MTRLLDKWHIEPSIDEEITHEATHMVANITNINKRIEELHDLILKLQK